MIHTNKNQNSEISERAYVIKYKYRSKKGHLQHRRWNASLRRWVDLNWIYF